MSKILLITFNFILIFSGAQAYADDFLLTEQNIYNATKEICHWNTADVISLLSQEEKLNIIQGQTLIGTEHFEKMLDLIRHDSFNKSFRYFQYTSNSEITQFILNSPAFSKALSDCYGDDKEAHDLIISKIYSAELKQKFYSAFLHIAFAVGSRKLLTLAHKKNKPAFLAGLSSLLSYYGWTIYDNRKVLNDFINNTNNSNSSNLIASSNLLKTKDSVTELTDNLSQQYQRLYAFNQNQIKILETESKSFKDPHSIAKINILNKIIALKNINQSILTKSEEKIFFPSTKDGFHENLQN